SCCRQEPVERPRELDSADRTAGRRREDVIIAALPPGARPETVLALALALRSERCHCARRERQRAARLASLRLDPDQVAADLLERPADAQASAVEVDVVPHQSQELTLAQAGCQGHLDQRSDAVA